MQQLDLVRKSCEKFSHVANCRSSIKSRLFDDFRSGFPNSRISVKNTEKINLNFGDKKTSLRSWIFFSDNFKDGQILFFKEQLSQLVDGLLDVNDAVMLSTCYSLTTSAFLIFYVCALTNIPSQLVTSGLQENSLLVQRAKRDFFFQKADRNHRDLNLGPLII